MTTAVVATGGATSNTRVLAGLPMATAPRVPLPTGAPVTTVARVEATGGAVAGDKNRGLLDGVTLNRPLDVIPNFITNMYERSTGKRDPRVGLAGSHLLIAGERFVLAGLRHASEGEGLIAKGSSFLGKVLPMFNIGFGGFEMVKGWNELQSHDDGILGLIHSKEARSGLLQVLAGASMLVPGVGGAVAAGILMVGAAANDLDAFKFLDRPTIPVEDVQGSKLARVAHPFDRTPGNPYDANPDTPQDRAQDQRDHSIIGQATSFIKEHFL